MNDAGEVYPPEQKVKKFLDSVAYCMMIGNMDGIVTLYKESVHAKREIPASCCPSRVENILYASGEFSEGYAQDEEASFRSMVELLDERASKCEPKRAQKHTQSLFSKRLQKNIRDGIWCSVDTEGKFWVGDNQYVIEDQETQYQPIQTEYGDYYAMDRILYSNGKFYDMNYDEVAVHAIGGILPFDSFYVGTET